MSGRGRGRVRGNGNRHRGSRSSRGSSGRGRQARRSLSYIDVVPTTSTGTTSSLATSVAESEAAVATTSSSTEPAPSLLGEVTRKSAAQTQRAFNKCSTEKKKELLQGQRARMIYTQLVPDAPEQKRKRKSSPLRKPVILVPGTPPELPPKVSSRPPWEVPTTQELEQLAAADRSVGTPSSSTARIDVVTPSRSVVLEDYSPCHFFQHGEYSGPLLRSSPSPPPIMLPSSRKGHPLAPPMPSTSSSTMPPRCQSHPMPSTSASPLPSTSSSTTQPRCQSSSSQVSDPIIFEDIENIDDLDAELDNWDKQVGMLAESDDDNLDVEVTQPIIMHGMMASDFPAVLPDNFDDEVVRRIQEQDGVDDAVIMSLLPEEGYNFKWTEDLEAFKGKREVFTGQAGPTFPILESTQPVDIFLKIFDETILALIVAETNIYAENIISSKVLKPRSRLKRWVPITKVDLLIFFAIVITQGTTPLPVEQQYWHGSRFFFTNMPHFKELMTYERYIMIKKFLHFVSITNEGLSVDQKRLHKIKPILDHLSIKFAEMFMPDQEIALDESLLKWKGRLSFSQKIATKAAEVGIKSFELCESRSGYLWSFKIYTGKEGKEDQITEAESDEPKGATARIVFDLARPLFNKGHTLIMDNFYNSPLLSRCLKQNGTDSMGTLRINREFVPQPLKTMKKTEMRIGEVCSSNCEDLTVLLWRDSNMVSMISTYHIAEIGLKTKHSVSKYKPQVVLDYNMAMGGVDRKDQLLAAFPMERVRNRVWYKKLFRRLINISVLNSFIIYKHKPEQGKLQPREFREVLALQLLSFANIGVRPTSFITVKNSLPFTIGRRSQMRPILEGNHFIEAGPVTRCIWCLKNGRDKRTTKRCNICHASLCVLNCFQAYHTLE